MENYVIKLHCYRCDVDVEPVLTISGPHIKACCSNCGRYIKFLGKDELPTDEVIMSKINDLTTDSALVLKASEKISFSNIPRKLSYHYWYVHLKKMVKDDRSSQP